MVVDNSQGADGALYELVYVSLARLPMDESGLRDLLTRAREANGRNGITGLLLYHEREFMQLIEGEREAVKRLFDVIERDPRHERVDVIWEGPVLRRSFQQWSMGFAVAEGADLRLLPGFEPTDTPTLTALPRGEPGRRVLMTLRDQLLKKDAPRGA